MRGPGGAVERRGLALRRGRPNRLRKGLDRDHSVVSGGWANHHDHRGHQFDAFELNHGLSDDERISRSVYI